MIARPDVPTMTQNANGDPVRTDGSLAVVELKNCESPNTELAQVSTNGTYKPGNIVFRYFRRQILTFRSDIWRANIIYAAYDLGHMSFTALKHRNATEADQQAKANHPPTNVNAVVRAAAPAGSSSGPGSH
jgi:hypothetical protein